MGRGVHAEATAMAKEKLTDAQIAGMLTSRPEWSETGGAIQRTFHFGTFMEAMAFVDKVAAQAEADQHHPDILIRYTKVTLTLNTHDAGGITEKDFALAAKVDAMAPAGGTKAGGKKKKA
jgi:4a-hydroxytetrahydrobiopterin dehydratase